MSKKLCNCPPLRHSSQSLKNVHRKVFFFFFIAATMDDTENDVEYLGGKGYKKEWHSVLFLL